MILAVTLQRPELMGQVRDRIMKMQDVSLATQ
jgi:hypothetical protein